MKELLLVNDKTGEVAFISDAISDLRAKHHLVTVHKIVHDVFNSWNERIFVYQNKVYLFICNYLDTHISSAEEDVTSKALEFGVLCPLSFFFSEEENRVAALADKNLIEDHVHVSERLVGKLVEDTCSRIQSWNVNSLALSKDTVRHISFVAVKNLQRKVSWSAFWDGDLHNLA